MDTQTKENIVNDYDKVFNEMGLRNIDLLDLKKSISVSCKSIQESSFRQVSNIISHAAEIEVFIRHSAA